MTRQVGFAALFLASCLLTGPLQAGPAGTPLPGGLADLTGKTGYLASAAGGIEAVDLLTGQVLWSSLEAQVPLLVAEDRLFAQAGTRRNRLRVLVYDLARKGEVLLESDPIVLPEWVVTGEAPGQSFHAEWKLERDGLLLTWHAEVWYHGKEKPTPERESQARKQAEGRARIDLSTGKVHPLPMEPAAVTLAPQVPIKDLEKKAIRWQGVVNGQYKAVILQTDSEQQRLLLFSWDRNGESNGSPRELIRARQVTLQPTLDQRMISVREVSPSPDPKPPSAERDRFAWSLINLETGEVVARVAFEPSTLAMTVIGPRLFLMQAGPITGSLSQTFQTSRILKVIDLASGKLLWQRPIAGKAVFPPER